MAKIKVGFTIRNLLARCLNARGGQRGKDLRDETEKNKRNNLLRSKNKFFSYCNGEKQSNLVTEASKQFFNNQLFHITLLTTITFISLSVFRSFCFRSNLPNYEVVNNFVISQRDQLWRPKNCEHFFRLSSKFIFFAHFYRFQTSQVFIYLSTPIFTLANIYFCWNAGLQSVCFYLPLFSNNHA